MILWIMIYVVLFFVIFAVLSKFFDKAGWFGESGTGDNIAFLAALSWPFWGELAVCGLVVFFAFKALTYTDKENPTV